MPDGTTLPKPPKKQDNPNWVFDNYEWYTPFFVIALARVVMGRIDLDPATCDTAQKYIKAVTHYTKDSNGMLHDWFGKVWMNPPYGREMGYKSLAAAFVHKMLYHYYRGDVTEAIVLVNAQPDRTWFAPLWKFPICFPSSRLPFWSDKHRSKPANASAIAYLGPKITRFWEYFEHLGPIVYLPYLTPPVMRTDEDVTRIHRISVSSAGPDGKIVSYGEGLRRSESSRFTPLRPIDSGMPRPRYTTSEGRSRSFTAYEHSIR